MRAADDGSPEEHDHYEKGRSMQAVHSQQFNALTPAEAERLFYLLEKLGEAQQAIGKILRHGYESYDPTVAAPPLNPTRRLPLTRWTLLRAVATRRDTQTGAADTRKTSRPSNGRLASCAGKIDA